MLGSRTILNAIDFLRLLTLSGTWTFSPSLFLLASTLLCFLNSRLFSVIDEIAWYSIIARVTHFESAMVFRCKAFLVIFYSQFSLTVFLHFYLLVLVAFFMLTTSPFLSTCCCNTSHSDSIKTLMSCCQFELM